MPSIFVAKRIWLTISSNNEFFHDKFVLRSSNLSKVKVPTSRSLVWLILQVTLIKDYSWHGENKKRPNLNLKIEPQC
jgi:hypothetical protein